MPHNTLPGSSRKSGIFLSLAVTLVMLACSELALRALMPAVEKPLKPNGWAIIPEQSWIEYHPVLGWSSQKNKSAFLKKENLSVPLSTNSLGLRGRREYAQEKPAGTKRIYAAGDSFTFGFGVKDEETFPFQLESLLPQTEVFNLGVPGYGVDQIALSIKEFGYGYNPDVILITLYPEDFWRSLRAFNDAGFGKPYFNLEANGKLKLNHVPVPREKNFRVAQFPELLKMNPAEKILYHSYLYRLGKRAAIKVLKSTGKEDPDTSPEWLIGREILKESVSEIKTHGARPILVIAPPLRWIQGTTEPIGESLVRFGTRENVDVIDLTSVFKKACAERGDDFYYLPSDGHWTAEGNKLAAKTISEYLSPHD